MKIRSLLLGSVAAAGLSTGAFAADLGVLTSLDVCDNLGLSGLTISSDTNCLQISGSVEYEFNWGDYENTEVPVYGWVGYGQETFGYDSVSLDGDNGVADWESRIDAWLQFVATAESDFGPAKAVLKLLYVSDKGYSNNGSIGDGHYTGGSDTGNAVDLDEAYVQIGDSTVIMAGIKGSIFEDGEDEPLNYLGLFHSELVDEGVGNSLDINDGGHVIQVVSDLGNGISLGAGLEDLDGEGTAVGIITYAGDGIAAHASIKVGDILGDHIAMDLWAVHAGFTGTFDNFKVVLAGAFDSNDYYNVLASASATFDIFTLAVSADANDGGAFGDDEFGVGASISAAVSDTVTVNLGGRYSKNWFDGDNYEIGASVTAAVTETITLTGEIGYVDAEFYGDAFYAGGEVAWAPGGGFTSSLGLTGNTEGGYQATFKAAKTFE